MKIALIIFAIVLVVMIYCSCRVAGEYDERMGWK